MDKQTKCPPLDVRDIEQRLNAAYDNWFSRLQQLSAKPLNREDWTIFWRDGYTPEEALEEFPDGLASIGLENP